MEPLLFLTYVNDGITTYLDISSTDVSSTVTFLVETEAGVMK